jgi:hypothetical protein
VSSSQSIALNCASAEILEITTQPGGPDGKYGVTLIFAPGSPLGNLAEGTVCINSETEGTLDTGGASNTVFFRIPNGEPVPYSIGEVVEVCEGECCFLGNFTKRCEYVFQESTLTWELVGSDDQRTIACNLDFKCVELDRVLQIHQFETLEQRNMFVCPQNPIGDPPEDCKSDCCLREVHYISRCINPDDPVESSSESSSSPLFIICKEHADLIFAEGCVDSSSSESDGAEGKNAIISITSPSQYAGVWGIQRNSTINANASDVSYILFTQAGLDTSCVGDNILESVSIASTNLCFETCEAYWASLNSSSSESDSSLSDSSLSEPGGDPPAINCSGDPDLIISITSGDPGNFPKDWCGITWVNSGATGEQKNNGEEARVCPTDYGINHSNGNYARNWWINSTTIANAEYLYMNRYLLGSAANHVIRLYTAPFGSFYEDFRNAGGMVSSNVGVLNTGTPFITYNEYLITPPNFMGGDFTDASGITYKWREGDNWPAP